MPRPEEQGAGTVEMLFLDVISARHQSVDSSVSGQRREDARRCVRSAERR